ncbi:hypothetical protein DRQ36_07665 [bacterium]|nr:MAG: hypothetical protein DRQ36_07665 [bacterium]
MNLKRINFLFAVHLHQPVGNFERVFEYATESAYMPFLKAMAKTPDFLFAFHASGPLWEYWENRFPEMFDIISEMVARRQIELLGGGFYEPILAVIPRRDAIAQLRMMSVFLEGKFGYKPRGVWLTERIWEPHLPELLAEAGVEYTLTDDYHFKCVGIVGEKLLGYYITEDNGRAINIFPISEDLRYAIPFKEPQDTVDFLIRNADRTGRRAVVFGDDGEKFGLWPGTKQWVWNEGWMKRFVEAILANSDVIEMRHFGEWIDRNPPSSRVYLPTGSYFEMSEWTLPAKLSADFHCKVQTLRDKGELEDWRPFIKGGFWRGFLTKYPEADWMHKRMLYASDKLSAAEPSADAAKALYRSQCNCAYWHGVFGGLYLPHLRRAVYNNILAAENKIAGDRPLAERSDIDIDGCDEVILRDGNLQLFIKPSDGGKIAEIDILKPGRNITDTLSRRPEGYHQFVKNIGEKSDYSGESAVSIHDIAQVKESGLANLLHYDWYNRRFLVDFVFGAGLSPKNLRAGDFPELGDFADMPFEIVEGPTKTEDGLSVTMRREGAIFHGDIPTPLTIDKTIVLRSGGESFGARYILKNPNDDELAVHFGTETHFSLMSRDHPDVHFHFPTASLRNIRPGETHEFAKIDGYELHEHADGFKIFCECNECALWMWPVETVSNSESGFERIYQQTSLLHHWRAIIPPTGEISIELNWRVEIT